MIALRGRRGECQDADDVVLVDNSLKLHGGWTNWLAELMTTTFVPKGAGPELQPPPPSPTPLPAPRVYPSTPPSLPASSGRRETSILTR